jgi:hypothetical protein
VHQYLNVLYHDSITQGGDNPVSFTSIYSVSFTCILGLFR